MKQRLKRIAKWVAYPAFYLVCLALFAYLSFPYDQLKDRLIAEFDSKQQKKARRGRGGGAQIRLEIDELDGYWITGVEVSGVRLTIPPDTKTGVRLPMSSGDDKQDDAPKPAVIKIDNASVRLQLLPLLLGNMKVNFDIDAFDGEIHGSAPLRPGSGDIEVELEGLQLSEVAPLRALLEGMPLLGVLSGSVVLSPKEGKFSRADGKLVVNLDDVLVGDGKTKVQGVALPAAQIGAITLEATAKDGMLTLDELSGNGRDLELMGEGKVKLAEAWDRSNADIFLKFKFADSYRDKNDTVKGLLGDSEGKIKPLIEAVPGSPFKRAKTDDGFYRFHLAGPLARMKPRPAGKKTTKRGRKGARTGGGLKGPGSFKMPTKRTKPKAARESEAGGSKPPAKPPSPAGADRDKGAAGEAAGESDGTR